MTELLQNLISLVALFFPLGMLWILANQRSGKPLLAASGALIAYPLYFLFQILLSKLLHYLRILNPVGLASGYALANLILFLLILRSASPASAREEKQDREAAATGRLVLGSAGLILFLISVVALLKPPLAIDENTYHLPMVANYFQNGSLAPWATQCLRQIYRPNGAELQMLHLALFSRSDAWMEVFQILGFLVSLIATFEIAMLLWGRRELAFLAMALVLGTPQILHGAAQGNNDLVFMAVILSGFYWLLWTMKESQAKRRGILLFALCGALASSVKVLGICVFVSYFASLCVMVFRKRLPHRSLADFLGMGLFLLFFVVGEIYWGNFIRSGIPFGIVVGEDSIDHFTFGGSVLGPIFNFYVIELSYKWPFLRFAYEYGGHHYGVLFPLLFLFGTLALVCQFFNLGSRRREDVLTLALLTFFLFFSITAFRRPVYADWRFMIWLSPAFGLLALSWCEAWRKKIIAGLTLLATAFALIYFGYIYTKPSSFGIAVKASFSHFFKSGTLPYIASVTGGAEKPARRFAGYDRLQHQGRPGDKVLYIGGTWSLMYPSWGKRFDHFVAGVRNLSDAYEKINSKDYRFIVVERYAERTLRDASLVRTASLGYVRIANTWRRVIYKRPD